MSDARAAKFRAAAARVREHKAKCQLAHYGEKTRPGEASCGFGLWEAFQRDLSGWYSIGNLMSRTDVMLEMAAAWVDAHPGQSVTSIPPILVAEDDLDEEAQSALF